MGQGCTAWGLELEVTLGLLAARTEGMLLPKACVRVSTTGSVENLAVRELVLVVYHLCAGAEDWRGNFEMALPGSAGPLAK